MGIGTCVESGNSAIGTGNTILVKDATETWTAKRVRFARMCVVMTTSGTVKLAIYNNVSGTTYYNYKALRSGNPLLDVVSGNNIFQSDRNWFQLGADTYYAGVWLNSGSLWGNSTGGLGYFRLASEVLENNSASFTDNAGTFIWGVGFLIIDCSISGNSGGASVSVGNTIAYYGNVNYQTWDVGYSQAYMNLFAPWEVEGTGWSGYVTVGTYAYTTTTIISGTLYTYRVYINSANSSSVGFTEYLYVQSPVDDVYVNTSGDDYNTGTSCSVPVQTFGKAYSLLNSDGTIYICNDGADFSSENITFTKPYSTAQGAAGVTNYKSPRFN